MLKVSTVLGLKCYPLPVELLHNQTPQIKGLLEKGNINLACQEISCTVRNWKIHYHVHKSLLQFSLLSQLSIVYILTYYFFNIHLTLSSHPYLWATCDLFSSHFLTKILLSHFILPHVPHNLPTSVCLVLTAYLLRSQQNECQYAIFSSFPLIVSSITLKCCPPYHSLFL